MHIKKMHESQVVRCNFNKTCKSYFLAVEERDKHVLEEHKTGKLREEATCIYCGKKYRDATQLSRHINNSHSKVKIKCRFHGCSCYFHTDQEHQSHFDHSHGEQDAKKVLKCRFCGYKCVRSVQLIEHESRIHGEENVNCVTCSKLFYSEFSLRKHVRNQHGEKVVCVHCKKPVQDIRCHLKSFSCNFCMKPTPCLSLHKQHYKECKERLKRLECRIFGKIYHNQGMGELRKHLARVHVPRIFKCWLTFKCKACFVSFDSLAEKKEHYKTSRHLKNVRGGAPFSCDHCKK